MGETKTTPRMKWARNHAPKLLDELDIPEGWEARVSYSGESVETFGPRPDYWSARASPGVDIAVIAPDFQSVLTNIQALGTHYADTDSFEECVEVSQKAINEANDILTNDT